MAILVFASALWLGFSAYVQSTTVPADGEIIQKQEIIEFGRADNWSREFEITFRYRAGGDANWTTASHNVNRTTYEHLNVGTSVGVHYSRYGLLRQIPGTGSYIEGTSAISRLPHGLSTQDLLLFGALLLFALTRLGALARAS